MVVKRYLQLCAIISFAIWFAFDEAGAQPNRETGAGIQPLITTSELVVGKNRFAFGVFQENKPVENGNASVRLYGIEGAQARLEAEFKAPYHLVENGARGQRVHRHADGTRHVHDSDTDVHGLYVSQIAFPRAGDWGLEILLQDKDGLKSAARTMVTVLEAPATPVVGSPAPRSRNLIARDVKNLRQLSTSERPDARLHQARIADAISQGKPQLIVFATPQFCTSRMCGPVVDIVRGLLPAYGKRVAFTHQEIWQDFAAKKVFATVEEWNINTEPWIFVVDRQGIIHAKFEGLVTAGELESAVKEVLPTRRVGQK
jgi:hypothetical protein